MARFTATVLVDAPASRAWAALVDWPAHARWVPLTRVQVLTAAADGVGARFCGRSGVGPFGFDDPMEVVRWEPPQGTGAGHCRVVKQGRVVLGEAWFDVVPLAPDRCRVDWTEDVEVVPVVLTRPQRRLLEPMGRLAFRSTLRRMAAEVEAAGTAEGTAAVEGGGGDG